MINGSLSLSTKIPCTHVTCPHHHRENHVDYSSDRLSLYSLTLIPVRDRESERDHVRGIQVDETVPVDTTRIKIFVARNYSPGHRHRHPGCG